MMHILHDMQLQTDPYNMNKASSLHVIIHVLYILRDIDGSTMIGRFNQLSQRHST